MYKLIALFAVLAVASAAPGVFPYVAAPAAVVAHHPVAIAAPAIAYHHAPIVKSIVPLATSYAHQYRVDYKTPAIYAAAPLAYAHPYAAYGHAPFLRTYIH